MKTFINFFTHKPTALFGIMLTLMLWSGNAWGQLNPGDIAIIQYNADASPDNIKFVALVDIAAGEQIKFTDNGWQSTNSWRTGEGVHTYTVPPGGLSCGDVVYIELSGPILSTSGDQIIAYQNTSDMIFGLNNEGAGVWQANATNANTSALPQGLTNGTNAVALAEADNAIYSGITTGTKADILSAICNKSNWTTNNASTLTFSGSFTITDCATATPTLAVSPASLSGLDYVSGSGPSAEQTFVLSGSDLDGSNVTLTPPANFEISKISGAGFVSNPSSLTYTAYDGSNQTIYVRLASGLGINSYSGNITIAGGGDADGESVALSGTVTGVPSIVLDDIGSTQVSAGDVSQGTSDHIVGNFELAVSTVNATFTGVDVLLDGSYLDADISGNEFQLWYHSSNAFASATAIDIQTATGSGGSGEIISFSGFSQTISSGATGYFWITADVDAAATVGNTIQVTSIDHSDLSFTVAVNSSGTTADAGVQTITFAPVQKCEDFSSLSESSYGDYTVGEFSTNNCICNTTNARSNNAIRIEDATGSYLLMDGADGNGVDGGVGTISFWYRSWDSSPAAVYDVAVSIDGAAYSTIGTINTTSTTYQEFTYAIDNSSDNIRVKIERTSGERLHIDDFCYTNYASDPEITLTGTDPNSADFPKGSTNNIVYRIEASTLVEAQDITEIAFRIDAMVTNLDELVSNYKLYYSADATLDAGDTQIESETTIAAAANQTVTFTGFTQTVAADATGYFFITTDILSNATIGEILEVSSADVSVTYTTNGGATDSENYNAANSHEIVDVLSDIVAVPSSESTFVSSIENTAGPLNSTQGVQVWQITVRDGSGFSDADVLPTIVTGITISQNAGNAMNDWGDAILSCDLFDGTTHLDQATVTANQIQFSGAPLVSVPDNGQKTLTLRLSIQISPNDGGQNNDGDDFVFNITNSNVTTESSATSSQFDAFTTVSSENGKNEFQVIATTLSFVQQPTDVGVNALMKPYVSVEGYDANGNIDLVGITISITSDGTMNSSPKTAALISGISTFNDIIHTVVQTSRTLTASAPGATPVTSDLFDVLDITTFAPGDLAIIAYDNYIGGVNDKVTITNFVEIKPGTKFWYANATFELKAAPGQRTNRWYSCNGDANALITAQEFEYLGPDILPAGSIICISIDANQVMGTDFTVYPSSGSGTYNFGDGYSLQQPATTLNQNINISISNPDAVFLMQGSWSGDLGDYREFYGNILGGIQDGGTWYNITDDTRGLSGSDARISRIPPDIQCFNIQGTSSPGSGYAYYSTVAGDHTGSHTELLSKITNFTTYWTQVNGGNADEISGNVCLSSYCFTIAGAANKGMWTNSKNNNDWFDCGNWENFQVPDETVDVIIPSTASGLCQVNIVSSLYSDIYNDLAECNNIDIQDLSLSVEKSTDTLIVHGNLTISGGTLDLNDDNAGTTNDGQLILYGNWDNQNDGFDVGNSKVTLFGDGIQEISSTATPELFNLLIVNNASDGILLNNDISIANLNQLNGNIDLNGSDITLTGDYKRTMDRFIGDIASNFVINNTGYLDSIYFVNDFNLNNFTLDRADDTATLMTDLFVQNTMTISNGTVVLTPTHFYDANTLVNSVGTTGLVLESNASGTASLIFNANPNTNANATCKRYMSADIWHYIFSPLSDVNASELQITSYGVTNPNFYYYDETVADFWNGTTIYNPTGWTNVSTPKLELTKGYILLDYQNRVLNFNGGNLDDEDKAFILSYTDSGTGNEPTTGTDWDMFEGWNLVGNPYSSALDWDDASHIKTNIANFIYYYDGVAEKYLCYGGVPPWSNNGVTINGGNNYIPANQAFFVKAKSTAHGANLVLSKDGRAHNAQPYYKNVEENILKLNIQKNDYTDEIVVRAFDGATDIYDEDYDAYKMFAWSGTKPQLFTSNTDFTRRYVINSIAPVTNYKTVPLGFYAAYAGQYTINVCDNTFINTHILLEDKKYDIFQNLNDNPIYTFFDNEGINNDRFILHFGENNAPVNMIEIPNQYSLTNTEWSFNIPENIFVDADAGDTLLINGVVNGGTCFPDWLSFSNGTFYANCPYPTLVNLEVIATDKFGAQASAYFTLYITEPETDIQNVTAETQIYPNPTTGIVNVSLTSYSEKTLISVISIDGKTLTTIVPTQNSTQIDLSNFAKGSYVIEVINGNSTFKQNVILK
ncbi:MAG: T9SS type A sorting domain-containing protein [Bacteroidales bacterium]|nr:T9SS type A sorting domain-containing protein [Bacteroidales bacterium]